MLFFSPPRRRLSRVAYRTRDMVAGGLPCCPRTWRNNVRCRVRVSFSLSHPFTSLSLLFSSFLFHLDSPGAASCSSRLFSLSIFLTGWLSEVTVYTSLPGELKSALSAPLARRKIPHRNLKRRHEIDGERRRQTARRVGDEK